MTWVCVKHSSSDTGSEKELGAARSPCASDSGADFSRKAVFGSRFAEIFDSSDMGILGTSVSDS